MKKTIVGFLLVLGSVRSLHGAVVLPESRRLAGPVDPGSSEYGMGFYYFPDFMEPSPAAPFSSQLSGWVDIKFAEPVNNKAKFTVDFFTVGSDAEVTFGGGQIYDFSDTRVIIDSRRINDADLDLETGIVSNVTLSVVAYDRTVNRLARVNRLFLGNPQAHPEIASPLGFPTDEFPQETLYTDFAFKYNSEGQIIGFDFVGQSLGPFAFVASATIFLHFLPDYFFGDTGEGYWPNPDRCLPGTPPERCPTDEDLPLGILLDPGMALQPHLFLHSNELRAVSTAPKELPCGPSDLAGDGVLVVAGGKLYHLGGLAGGAVSGRVAIYDPATSTWSEGPPLPTPVFEAQGGVVGSKIYVIGGRTSPDGPATDRVQILDSASGLWSDGAPAPQALARGAVTVFGDWIVLLSGMTNRPNGSPRGNLRFNSRVQIYDSVSDTWSSRRAALDGSPIYREGASAATVGSDLYLMGGRTIDDQVTSSLVIFHVLTSRFRHGPEALWGTYQAAAGVVANRLYLAGGRREVGGPADSGLQSLELSSNEWYKSPKLPMGVAGSGHAVLYGTFYLAGGRNMSALDDYPGAATSVVQAYDPALGWAVCSTQPTFTSGDVLNTASLAVGSAVLSPGSQASLLGYNLAPETLVAPAGEAVPVELGGVSLTVNGLAAPLLAVSPERIDFQIPYGTPVNRKVDLALSRPDLPQQAPAIEIPLADFGPGIFIQNCGAVRDLSFLERSTALACHPDGALNYAINPVPPGGRIKIQMTGLGAVDPPLANGERAPADAPPGAVTLPVVRILGANGEFLDAPVLAADLAPGEIGIYDVEVLVPEGALVGPRVAVQATVQGVTSNLAVISVGVRENRRPIPCHRDSDPLIRRCVVPRLNTPAPIEPRL